MRQREQRELPRAAALAVGVVVELIEDHVAHVGLRAFTQGHVGEDFGRAAEDRRAVVDRGVARGQPDVLRAELPAEREPLLVDQRLDRAGVDGAPPLRERLELERRGDERFTRAGGRVEDDVLLLEQLQDGGFLRGVEFEGTAGDVFEEPTEEEVVRRQVRRARQEIVERQGHGGGRESNTSPQARVFAMARTAASAIFRA